MGRRGWAITIVAGLVVIAGILAVVQSGKGPSNADEFSWDEEKVQGNGHYKVVQLFVEGTIAEQGGFRSSFAAGDFLDQLEQARKDEEVKAVVIRVNSPGGEVVASDEIYNKILSVKEAGKPVIVSMGATAASGGYYISAPADYIFANPSTLTGSLGVIFSIPNYEKAANWIGYKENTIKSGEFKDIGSPLREMTDKERAIFQQLVSESYNQFVSVIEKGRNLPKDKVLALADGRVYSGLQAKELGLIDEFGSLEKATFYALTKANLPADGKVVKYVQSFSLVSLFSSMKMKLNPLSEAVGQMMPEVASGPKLLYLFQ